MQKDQCDESEIYVGNVPREYCEKDIHNVFSAQKYKVVRVKIKKNDNNKTYAFVKFATVQQAKDALEEYKNTSLDGRKLVLRCSSRVLQRDPTKPESSSTSPIPNGLHPSNEINGHESDVSDDSNGPPPLVPIPRHIMMMMIRDRDRNAALLSEKKPLEPIQITRNYGSDKRLVHSKRPKPALLPTPVLKETAKNLTPLLKETSKDLTPIVKEITKGKKSSSESSAIKCERIAKIIICDFPPGTTEIELLELFEMYCPVKCKVMANSADDSIEGFTYAFIFLPSGRAAALASSKLNESVFKGNKISVKHVDLPDALLNCD